MVDEAIHEKIRGSIVGPAGQRMITNAEEKRVNSLIARLEQEVTRLRNKLNLAGEKFEEAYTLHTRMMTPSGVSNQTMHGCELCDSLNSLASALAPAVEESAGER